LSHPPPRLPPRSLFPTLRSSDLIRRIQPDDEIFLMTFSGQPFLRHDFTDDRDKLSQALRRIYPTGGTALYDALADGVNKIHSSRDRKGTRMYCSHQVTSYAAVDG